MRERERERENREYIIRKILIIRIWPIQNISFRLRYYLNTLAAFPTEYAIAVSAMRLDC